LINGLAAKSGILASFKVKVFFVYYTNRDKTNNKIQLKHQTLKISIRRDVHGNQLTRLVQLPQKRTKFVNDRSEKEDASIKLHEKLAHPVNSDRLTMWAK
jgi:hypothetical protein